MAKPKDEKDETLTEMLGIRVAKSDLDRLDAIAEKLPVASRHAFARVCMRIGLDAVERDPGILLGAFKKGRR